MTAPEQMTEAEAWRELAPLRKAVAAEFARPMMPSQQGLDDLVDRTVVAVAKYMSAIVPATAEQHRRMADAMDQLDRVTVGSRPGCPGCGAQIVQTKRGQATLHRAGCKGYGS